MFPPKPHDTIKKPERLREKRRMTICIGLLASDGVVIAADREEGDGYLKNDRGKIRLSCRLRGPNGSIAITGAGDGPSLDEVSKLMGDVFCSQDERTSDDTIAALHNEHCRYYRKKVIPFAPSPSDRPDYALIIGCMDGQTLGKKLFYTSKLAFNETNDYEAVGIGASVANTWLWRLYDRVPIVSAVKLAAYIIYQVKNSVGGCGLGTDIIPLRSNRILESVPREVVRKWEDTFRFFPSLERNIFHYCIGVDIKEDLLFRTKLGKQAIDAGIENIRNALTPPAVEKSKGQP
jgi:20S proteasome alpha/beta subunit